MMADNFAAKDNDSKVEFTVRLADLGQLFEAPELDPFVDQPRVTSGVEDMVAYLSTRRLRKLPAATATLQLPRAAATPDAAAMAKTAMQRYCDARIAEAQRATDTPAIQLHRQAWRQRQSATAPRPPAPRSGTWSR